MSYCVSCGKIKKGTPSYAIIGIMEGMNELASENTKRKIVRSGLNDIERIRELLEPYKKYLPLNIFPWLKEIEMKLLLDGIPPLHDMKSIFEEVKRTNKDLEITLKWFWPNTYKYVNNLGYMWN